MNCHEAIDLMDTALENALPEASRPGFASHLDECAPCRTYLGQLGQAAQALRRLPRAAAEAPGRAELIRRFREQARRDLS